MPADGHFGYLPNFDESLIQTSLVNHQNVQKAHFLQRAPGVNGLTTDNFQGAFKHLTSGFVSSTVGRFSEHQDSVVQNILLS